MLSSVRDQEIDAIQNDEPFTHEEMLIWNTLKDLENGIISHDEIDDSSSDDDEPINDPRAERCWREKMARLKKEKALALEEIIEVLHSEKILTIDEELLILLFQCLFCLLCA